MVLGQVHRLGRLPAGLAVLGDNRGPDAAADIEAAAQAHEARAAGGYEVVEDAIGHVLVEMTLVAERPDIELECLELEAEPIGDVLEFQRREIRPSSGTGR